MMDALSPFSGYERIVVKTSSQIGKSEIINCFVGFIIDQDPGPCLVVQPTVEMGKSWSKDRLMPMLRDSPVLAGRVAPSRSRDSENTILHKQFLGGHVTVTGANAPSGLAARPIRYVLADEIDRYPASAGTEGDPISLAIRRTNNFWNKKIVMVSTPTTADRSRIDAEWRRSDQREFFVPCPDCGEMQTLKWARVKWDAGEPENAWYECEECGAVIPTYRKMWMLSRGEWRKGDPESKVAGFHLNELYSPWRSFGQTATDFLAAKGAPETLRTWINTALGETWEERGEAPDWQLIYQRREEYRPGIVPKGGFVLTAGADVQDDRIEVSIWAWGRDRERWLVDHRVLMGSPASEIVWAQLDTLLSESIEHEGGCLMKISRLAIDTGGHFTNEAYLWCRRHDQSLVMAIKGVGDGAAIVGTPRAVDVKVSGARVKRGLKLWPVAGGIVKQELYNDLKKRPPIDGEEFPPGYVHLPKVDAEFCQQLTAEQLVSFKGRTGYTKREWQKTRERNEALDCAVYARAAAVNVGVDRFTDEKWDEFENSLEPALVVSGPQRLPRPREESWLGRTPDDWI